MKVGSLRYLVELSVLLLAVRVRLSRYGFEPTVAWATAVRGAPPGDTDARRLAEVTKARAEQVLRWHPVANKCLEQSLLVSRFLARRGVKTELLFAVRKYPFESHAWVRWQDVTLTAPPDGPARVQDRHPRAAHRDRVDHRRLRGRP